jgi:hypothetical protein
VLIVLTHVAEALHLFPFMGWGREHGVGHYQDLASAGIAVTLFPIGYLLQILETNVSGMAQRPLDAPNRP